MHQQESESLLNSSRLVALGSLARRVNSERADRFLCELANFPDRQGSPELPEKCVKAWGRLWRLYGDLFPGHGNPDHEGLYSPSVNTPGLVWEFLDDPGSLCLEYAPPKLRQAWLIPTALGREVFVMCELAHYLRGPAMFSAAKKALQFQIEARDRAEKAGATQDEAFDAGWRAWQEALSTETGDPRKSWAISEAAVDAFALVLLRAMHVADRLRYCPNAGCPAPYFIAKRRSQKYCSDACALPAQREFKKRWWAEHGSRWRETHARVSKGRRKAKRSERKRGK